jgi:dienelactone hydrolase
LPKEAAPPYPVVVYMGGYGTLTQRAVPQAAESLRFGFVVRSGRALVVPAYKGTLERGPGAYYHQLGQPNLWREMNLQWSMDLGRTIDYLETRTDMDTAKLAFYGFSMGAAMGPRLVAVEPRIKTAVFLLGGSFERVPPEVDSWNFASRVRVPVLMLNGRDDFSFPLESSQNPLFEQLGTLAADKKHIVYPGGHNVGNAATRPDFIREFLDWLDRYLGPAGTGD